MNRFEWMMVLICGLGLAWVITTQKPAPAPAGPAPVSQSAETATGAPTAASPSPDTSIAALPEVESPAVPTVEATETVLKNTAAEYTFTNRGGGIRSVKILTGPYAGRTEQLMNHRAGTPIGALLSAQGVPDTTLYSISSSTDRSITYTATTGGIEITKTWTMRDGEPTEGWGYVWDLRLSFRNTGDTTPGNYYLYAGLLEKLHTTEIQPPSSSWYADESDGQLSASKFESSGFLGFGARPPQSEIRTPLTDLTWAGVHNQFYASLISPSDPPKGRTVQLLSRRHWLEYDDPGYDPVKDWAYDTALELSDSAPPAAGNSTWSGEIYTGPRSGTVLNRIGGDRNEAMHYGWFSSLSRLFLGALNLFHKYVSFGLAIVFLTIVVRFVIWPLSLKATRSMKRMSKLSPLMTDLKEKYKDDPQKMQVETMKLYRDYGVNPVGGCLPVLLQFPIFLGYYHMMQGAVEMRGHNFLWVTDLSLPDTVAHIAGFPLNPLPLLMAVTMYIQMKVAPQPATTSPQMETQQKIFKIMPVFFLLFCYATASALALYWTIQNLISILQTWIVRNQPDEPLVKKPRTPGFLERAQAAAVAQQKAKNTRPPAPGSGKSTFKKG